MLEQAITSILETNVKMKTLVKKQKMQRDKEILNLETEIPEPIQSELRKKDTKKMNRVCGIRTKIEHLCHQSPRRRGENIQC